MIQADLLTTANNKDNSIDEKFTISNVFKDKILFEEDKASNIPFEKEINLNTIIRNKNESNNNFRNKKLTKNNRENNQAVKDSPSDSTNNFNYNSAYNLNGKDHKNLFDPRDYNNHKINDDNIAQNKLYYKGGVNDQYIKNVKNKKDKKYKRVKFKTQFLNIVEIESYKSFNANMCYSDLEFVDTGERKSLCKELCTIL